MVNTLRQEELRRWAARCKSQAEAPLVSGEESERLLKMRRGILQLARNAAWLKRKLYDETVRR